MRKQGVYAISVSLKITYENEEVRPGGHPLEGFSSECIPRGRRKLATWEVSRAAGTCPGREQLHDADAGARLNLHALLPESLVEH